MTLSRVLYVIAVVTLGLAAGAAFAHVLEMPNKLTLDAQAWFMAQSTLYDGWTWKLAIIELIAVLALGWLAWFSRGDARLALIGAILSMLSAEMLVWALWISPVNIAVENWPRPIPMTNWEALRDQWESGQIVRFGLFVGALFLTAYASPASLRPASR